MRRQFSSLLARVSANSVGNYFLGGLNSVSIGAQTPSIRMFAHTELGTITTQLNKLDEITVQKIEDELRQVDKDSDGR